MISLILCGGAGTRLWPISRQQLPKQFYPLFDEQSLFQGVIERNLPFTDAFFVAANADQSFLAFDQLAKRGIKERKGLIEPVGRNTAPAIALVAMCVDPTEVILVNPSDHLIMKTESYREACARAVELAMSGRLVTFGITPAYPETGYGYIEHVGESVSCFKEKPDLATAKAYVESGRFLWNAGIFCFTAGVFLSELKRLSPDLYTACEVAFKGSRSRAEGALLSPTLDEMKAIPSISVDYAVFERSDRVSVIPCDIGWNDLGSFDSLYSVSYDSESGNSVLSESTPIFIDSKDNLVISRGEKKIVLIDVKNTSVIDTEDALLVVKRGSGQRVKEAVNFLKAESSPLLLSHTTVARPWGSYTVLLDTDRVKVKRLVVNPGQRISLQMHRFRQEHWVCIDGHGIVRLNEADISFVRTVEVQIPPLAIHRLECTGNEPLVVIETQIGTYFGEDDIIRLEDDYRRGVK
jgi:mannose-1-phosphate guanylyltransferase